MIPWYAALPMFWMGFNLGIMWCKLRIRVLAGDPTAKRWAWLVKLPKWWW